MTTEGPGITVSGIRVQVERKDIKNLHLAVYPPDGRVRVAAPLVVSDEALRLAVIGKLGWIRQQQARFADQPRQSEREMVNGESHYFLGRRYRLRVQEHQAPPRVSLHGITFIHLMIRPGSDPRQREAVLLRWYRQQLKALIAPLLEKWQARLEVRVGAWGVKRMKTKWGSCNPGFGRVWFNLELAKKPVQCLEYVVAHELAHLRERQHNERFTALLDQQLPSWRQHRERLNRTPLAHENWHKN